MWCNIANDVRMFDQFIQFINRDHHVSCSEKINCYLLSLYTAKYTMFLLIESIPCRNVYQLIFRDAQMIAIITWVTNIDYTYAKTSSIQCSMTSCRRQGVTLEAIKHVHVHHTHSVWFTVTSVSSLNGHDMLTFEVTGITESAWRQIPFMEFHKVLLLAKADMVIQLTMEHLIHCC